MRGKKGSVLKWKSNCLGRIHLGNKNFQSEMTSQDVLELPFEEINEEREFQDGEEIEIEIEQGDVLMEEDVEIESQVDDSQTYSEYSQIATEQPPTAKREKEERMDFEQVSASLKNLVGDVLDDFVKKFQNYEKTFQEMVSLEGELVTLLENVNQNLEKETRKTNKKIQSFVKRLAHVGKDEASSNLL